MSLRFGTIPSRPSTSCPQPKRAFKVHLTTAVHSSRRRAPSLTRWSHLGTDAPCQGPPSFFSQGTQRAADAREINARPTFPSVTHRHPIISKPSAVMSRSSARMTHCVTVVAGIHGPGFVTIIRMNTTVIHIGRPLSQRPHPRSGANVQAELAVIMLAMRRALGRETFVFPPPRCEPMSPVMREWCDEHGTAVLVLGIDVIVMDTGLR